MQLGFVRAVIPLLDAGPGQRNPGGPEKFHFYWSKGHGLPCYLFMSYVKFSSV